MRTKKQIQKELEHWEDILTQCYKEPDLFGDPLHRPKTVIETLKWVLGHIDNL